MPAYSYGIPITIDHTKVPGDLTNFPVLISTTIATLKTVSNGGHVQNSSGFDIGFTSDSLGASLLKWEVESYDPTTGAIVAWVLIASLSSSVDTIIYVCYGDVATTTFQGDVHGTWDANFKAVYHLGGPNGGTLVLTDSTSNSKTLTNGTPAYLAISAKVGSGGDFTNSNGGATGGGLFNSTFGDTGNPLTYEAWFQIPATGSFRNIIANNGNSNDGRRIQTDSTNKLSYTRGGIADHLFSSLTSLIANTWYYMAVTVNGTTVICYLGIAGGSLTSQTLTGVSTTIGGTPSYILINAGNSGSVGNCKYVDEPRVSNIARSANWFGACFANQDSPSTFSSNGSESFIGIATLTLNISETLSLGDSLAPSKVDTYLLNDAITLTDIMNYVAEVDQVLGESLAISDSPTTLLLGLLETISNDSLNLTDALQTILGISIIVNEQLTFDDDFEFFLGSFLYKSLSENLSITDALALQLVNAFILGDTLSLIDTVNLFATIELAVNDSITLSDTVIGATPPSVLTLILSEALVITDSSSIGTVTYLNSYLRRYLNDVPGYN